MEFNIKQLRKQKGLTQGEVAKRVGVTLMSYQIWERGYGKPTPENMQKLKEVLEVK
jgi:transcriptional regulator with XRE-family HTH domain